MHVATRKIGLQRGRAGYDQDGYNYLISGMPEYTIVFVIKSAITNCYTIKKEKKRERLRDKREQESIAITQLTEKGAKTLRSVAAFLCGAE